MVRGPLRDYSGLRQAVTPGRPAIPRWPEGGGRSPRRSPGAASIPPRRSIRRARRRYPALRISVRDPARGGAGPPPLRLQEARNRPLMAGLGLAIGLGGKDAEPLHARLVGHAPQGIETADQGPPGMDPAAGGRQENPRAGRPRAG